MSVDVQEKLIEMVENRSLVSILLYLRQCSDFAQAIGWNWSF